MRVFYPKTLNRSGTTVEPLKGTPKGTNETLPVEDYVLDPDNPTLPDRELEASERYYRSLYQMLGWTGFKFWGLVV